MDGRARQLAAMESYPCPACRKAEAQKSAEALGLPQLIGSDKQIAWAAQIRERALRLLSVEKTEKIKPESSSKWWIENRYSLGA